MCCQGLNEHKVWRECVKYDRHLLRGVPQGLGSVAVVVVDQPQAGVVLPGDDLEPVAQVPEGVVVPQLGLRGRLAPVRQD